MSLIKFLAWITPIGPIVSVNCRKKIKNIYNPYLEDFGNVRERHFWTKNPESRDVIVRRYHVVGKIIPEILGFELASFSDKKSRCFWERQGASFLDKKFNAIYCVQI